MNSNNWLKLNRSILKSSVFDNPKLLKVWIWCLCKASHKERDQLVGKQVQHLLPGQFIYGRKKASEELKIPESTLNDYMKLLKKMKNINIKSNNKYSVITIENWGLYQTHDFKSNSKSNNKSDNKWTSNGHQMDTNKNVYKEKNVKNYSSLKRKEQIKKKSEQVLKELNNESND